MSGLFNLISSPQGVMLPKANQPALLKVKLGACIYCFIFPRRPYGGSRVIRGKI